MDQTIVKFYQTGTFTVGNRLLAPDQRSVQADTCLLYTSDAADE